MCAKPPIACEQSINYSAAICMVYYLRMFQVCNIMSANSYVLFSRVASPTYCMHCVMTEPITSYSNNNFRMRWSELRSTMWVDIKIQTLK